MDLDLDQPLLYQESQSPAERERQMESNRSSVAKYRANQTPQARELRLETDDSQTSLFRSTQDPDARNLRMEFHAVQTAQQRANETPDDRQQRQQLDAAQTSIHRANENPGERQQRQSLDAEQTVQQRANETPAQRLQRNQTNSARTALQRANEIAQEAPTIQNLDNARHAQTNSKLYIGLGMKCNVDQLNMYGLEPILLGKMTTICYFCKAIGIRCENRGTILQPDFGIMCCNAVQYHERIIPMPSTPAYFQNIFTSQDPLYKYFRTHIRKFNSGLCMASMKATNETLRPAAISAFTISGTVYRGIGSLTNEPQVTPRNIQTYFYDHGEQAKQRTDLFRGTSVEENQKVENLFRTIHEELIACENSYLISFLTVNEIISNMDNPPADIQIAIHADRKTKCRASRST
jgi:hypothetical protein